MMFEGAPFNSKVTWDKFTLYDRVFLEVNLRIFVKLPSTVLYCNLFKKWTSGTNSYAF